MDISASRELQWKFSVPSGLEMIHHGFFPSSIPTTASSTTLSIGGTGLVHTH